MNPTFATPRSRPLKKPTLATTRRAFTLVEIVVSLFILGLLSLGIVSATLQVRRSAEATMRESNANAVAMGFLEQLQGMDYTMLLSLAQEDGEMQFVIRDGTPLTVQLNEGDYTGPLDVPINVDETGDEVVNMDFWVQANVEPSAGGLPSVDIQLLYRWENPHTREISDGELLLVRARSQ